MQLKKMVEGLIELFLKNFIQILYPKMNNIEVGAIGLRGRGSQYNLIGTFHGDYQQGVMNRRCPNERPFLIILELDEFKF